MTYPITPVPSFHIDPTAGIDEEAQFKAAVAQLQQMLSMVAPEIIQLILNAILKAFGLGKFIGTIDELLTKLEEIMSAIPSDVISGAIQAADNALREFLFGAETIGTEILAAILPPIAISAITDLAGYLTNLGSTGIFKDLTKIVDTAENELSGFLANLSPAGIFTDFTKILNTAENDLAGFLTNLSSTGVFSDLTKIEAGLGGSSLGNDLDNLATALFGTTTVTSSIKALPASVENVLGGSDLGADIHSIVDNVFQGLNQTSPVIVQQATSTSFPLSFTNPVTAGNTVVVLATGLWSGTSSTSNPEVAGPTLNGSSVSGSYTLWNQGGSSNAVLSTTGTNDAVVSGWVLPNCPAVNGLNFSTFNPPLKGVVAYEVSGLGSSPTLNVVSSGNGSTGSPDSGATSDVTGTGTVPVLMVGAEIFSATTPPIPGPGSGEGWTTLAVGNNGLVADGVVGYQIGSVGSSYEWKDSLSSVGNWAVGVAAITGPSASGKAVSTIKSSLQGVNSTLFGQVFPGTHVLATSVKNVLGGTNLSSDLSTVATTLFGSVTTAAQVLSSSISPVLTGGTDLGSDLQSLLDAGVNGLSGGSGSGNTLASFILNLRTISQADNIAIPPNPGTGTVTHDANASGTPDIAAAPGLATDWTHVTGATANIAVVRAAWASGTTYAPYARASALWGATETDGLWTGTSMTQVAEAYNFPVYTAVFALWNPPAGSTTVYAQAGISGGITEMDCVMAESDTYIGAASIANIQSVGGALTATPSITQSCSVGDMVLNSFVVDKSSGITYSGSGTQRYNDTLTDGFSTGFVAGDYSATTSSATFTCGTNLDSSAQWAGLALNLLPLLSSEIGSGFTGVNTSTTATACTVGNEALPNSFFSQTAKTADLTYSGTGNTVTVTYAGWYAVTVSVLLHATGGSFGVCLIHNGDAVQIANAFTTTVTGTGPYSNTFVVYCSAGDTLQPGYSASSASAQVVGEATGTKSYFSVALLNRSVY